MFKCLAYFICILVFVFSLYYLIKEKEDAESKKIYTIASVISLIALLIVFLLF